MQAGLVAILGAALVACSSSRRAEPAPAEAPPVAAPPEDAAAVVAEPPSYEVIATGVRDIDSIAVTGSRVVLGDGDRVFEVPKAAGGTPKLVLALGHYDDEITFEDQVGFSHGSSVAAWGDEPIAGRVVVHGKRPEVELLRVSRPEKPFASRAPAYGASSLVVVGDALFWQADLIRGPGPLIRTDLKTGRSQTVIPLPINWYSGAGDWQYATDGRVVVQLEVKGSDETSTLYVRRIGGGDDAQLWHVEGVIEGFVIADGAVYAQVSGENDGVWRVPLDRTPPTKLAIDSCTNVFARGNLVYVATYLGLVAVRGTTIGKLAPGELNADSKASAPRHAVVATDETHAYWIANDELRRVALPPAP